MKININKIKEAPKHVIEKYCVFGKPDEELIEWIQHNKIKMVESGQFTNLIFPDDIVISNVFHQNDSYEWVDGFSPNLNKYLHFGHASNFVLAKAFQKMGIGQKFIAILGDTLTGEVKKEDALNSYKNLIKKFNYDVHEIFFASNADNVSGLIPGSGEYDNTMIFDLGDKKIVGIKSSGQTTYFYQDVALAQKLNGSTLYMTGSEQKEHFDNLKKLYPHIDHLPMGLVSVNKSKMSSSLGNVIYLEHVLELLNSNFSDIKLVWNILAGYILKSSPTQNKKISLEDFSNPKKSPGLYLSYTIAKLKSAGMNSNNIENFDSNFLQYKYIKSKNNLQPNILLDGLLDVAKEINVLYETHYIKNNKENQKLFQPLLNDLIFGMKKMGLYNIDEV